MKSRKSELPLIAGIALLALIAGLASGNTAIAVAVGLGLYGARQRWLVGRLAKMLRAKQRLDPPFPAGPWQEIFGTLRSMQMRSRKRKRRLNRFVSRFQEAAAALPDAIVILGRENRIEWRNPAADTLLNLPPESCIGAPIETLISDPFLADHLRGADFARTLEMPAPGDRAVILSVLVTRFGRRRQHILVARDITRVFHLDAARRDFVANVSHELRTPLTVLCGNLEMLAECAADDTSLPTHVATMRDNTERMRFLVDDLLLLSRLEMDAGSGTEEPVDVPALLASIVHDARVLAAASHHALHLDAASGPWLYARPAELHSAFLNLLHNAVRHTPQRSNVDIRWYEDEDGAHLLVADNGPGIAPRHIPRLTERFYRADESRSAQSGGTGLGLAIVNQVLDHHGATLSVRSREGAGSTFGCHFPVARIAKAPEKTSGE